MEVPSSIGAYTQFGQGYGPTHTKGQQSNELGKVTNISQQAPGQVTFNKPVFGASTVREDDDDEFGDFHSAQDDKNKLQSFKKQQLDSVYLDNLGKSKK